MELLELGLLARRRMNRQRDSDHGQGRLPSPPGTGVVKLLMSSYGPGCNVVKLQAQKAAVKLLTDGPLPVEGDG